MNTKRRLIIPVLLCLAIVGSLVYGGWLGYDAYVDRSGWVQEEGVVFYRDFHGDPVSGWLELEGKTYYFDAQGRPLRLWQQLEGRRWYFDGTGVLQTGWQEIGGEKYYLGETGAMHAGWLELEGLRYYLPEGKLATSWQQIEGDTYYFGSGGTMALGIAAIGDERYYFGNDGILQTGAVAFGGEQYLFREDGAMHTGWLESEAGRRYYHSEGPMALGWQEIGGKRYWFREDGIAHTGWFREGEYAYYLREDGSAAVGPTEIDGAVHYFSPKGIEVILVNGNNLVPAYYEQELKQITGYHYADTRCYDSLMEMLADCEKAGIQYTFNSAYRSQKEQKFILETRTQEHMETYELSFEEAREKALETVALPGTSEHQLGLAVDLLGEEAVAWFQEHCWDYGFICRYTSDKVAYTGIVDEPWHFRYVGREVSLDMKDSGLCLEEYLGADPVKPWLLPDG